MPIGEPGSLTRGEGRPSPLDRGGGNGRRALAALGAVAADELAVLTAQASPAALPVVEQRLLGAVDVAAPELADERPVLVERFAHRLRIAGVLQLDYLGLLEHDLVEGEQAWVPAAGHEQPMETGVLGSVRHHVLLF